MSRARLALTVAGIAVVVAIWAVILSALPDADPAGSPPASTSTTADVLHGYRWYGDCAAHVEAEGGDPRSECTPTLTG